MLGNAVLLTRGPYDAELAGVDKDALRARTLATLKHFAASNRLTGGTEWGRKLFFDTPFQSYFVLAARLLWDDLDEVTRRNVDTIVREQAQYTAVLGTGDDPDSDGWNPRGLDGGFQAEPSWRRWESTPRRSPPASPGRATTRGTRHGAAPSAGGAATRRAIPLAFLAQVAGDRAAARCELALAERLEAYQPYPPQYRLAKFSGEPKYEPEARAELAISYPLHEWRARSGHAPVQPPVAA
ncbi:hypothetical protein [Streptomyces sp. OE57]|uniref:hypothetical protein n=1 Tax=Streptomyces lacaronensis TaxID=3379885 RepID=UPI0039B77985